MTQEQKQLLLVDLSARLPYNAAIDCRDEDSRFTCYLTTDILREIQNNNCYWEYKPFLFPLSNMTEEQKKEYCNLQDIFLCSSQYPVTDAYELFDWLNKNHFDFRNLIGRNLAIDCTNLNIY